MASATDANILSGLPLLKWRGLQAPPYSLVTFDYENSLSPRNVPYLDDDIHDYTGRRSFPMTARLMFLNTVEGGTTAGVRNFPDYWNLWRDNLDGEAGNLEHPVLGPLRARVKGAKGEIRAESRAGIIVEVAWVSTLEDPSTLGFLADLQIDHLALATAAGTAAYQVGVYYPKGGTAAPAATDIFDALSAALSEAFGAVRSAVDKMRVVMGRVGTMIEAVQVLDDASSWPALDGLTQLWSSLKDLVKRLVKAVRPTASRTITAPTTLDAFAIGTGNTLSDIMSLNVHALATPLVRKGATLTYYA